MTPPDNTPATIALTGATGFVGGHTLDHLLAQGHRVRALVRREPPRIAGAVDWVHGDLSSPDALDQLVAGCDAVIHIAGAIKARNRHEFEEVNVRGTQNLLGAIAQGAATAPLVHVSTIAARHPHLSGYAASKRAAEKLIEENRQANSVILRVPAVYGPGDLETLFYFKAALSAFAFLPGQRENRTALIHVSDLASALIHLAVNPLPQNRIITVDDGAGEGHTIGDVLNYINPGRRTGANTVSLPLPVLATLGGLGKAAALLTRSAPMLTPGKARELCHTDWSSKEPRLSDISSWRPAIAAPEGLRTTLDWYREHAYLKA